MSDLSNIQNDSQAMGYLSRLREGMQVYGTDGKVIGTIDDMHGDGFHVNGKHFSASAISRVTENRVYLREYGDQAGMRAGTQTEGEIRVPVVEEHLDVEKRQGQLGEVGIRREVVEEKESIPVELRREEVHVERRDVDNRPLGADEAAHAFEEGTIRVPVRGEEAIVTKEAVVTGEVVVNKEQNVERQQITDTVRKQRVEIDEDYKRARSGFEKDFKDRQRKSGGARTFDEAEPNYRMGFDTRYDERYAGRSFDEVEPDLRRSYESQSKRGGDSWEELRDEIREGWNRARSR